jgi:hypothetical protein
MHAQATLGKESLRLPLNTGWTCKDVNIDDPVEVELTGRLQVSALSHAAGVPGLLPVHMLVIGMRSFFNVVI